jgi:hypothetical protein
MNRLKTFLWLTMVGLAACVKNQDQNLQVSHFISVDQHATEPVKIEQEGLLIEGTLSGDMIKGELVLVLKINNDRAQNIIVDYTLCNLSIDTERVAIPAVNKESKMVIEPGEEELYELRYHPINSVDFYERSGYRGDMKQKYTLALDFIKDNKGALVINRSIDFQFDDEHYARYQEKAREKNMRIFDFDFDSEIFAQEQIEYLVQNFKDTIQHEVFAITPAITIDRVVTNFRSYQENDTLVIDLRMLNQSPHRLDVIAARSEVKVSGRILKPCKYFSDSFGNGTIDSIYAFKPGTRLHLLLKYHVTEKFDRWQLMTDWLAIYGAKSRTANLMYTNISFRESSITKKRI